MLGYTIRKTYIFQLRVGGTLTDLINTSGDDVGSFLQSNNYTNRTRATNIVCNYDAALIRSIKALQFELKNRRACDTLPDLAVLQTIDATSLCIVIHNRTKAQEIGKHLKSSDKVDVEVSTLTSTKFENVDQNIKSAASRRVGATGIPLDYILRSNVLGNYDAVWNNRLYKLKSCLNLDGDDYTLDNQSLYDRWVICIKTEGTHNTTLTIYKHSKNGRQIYLDLQSMFVTTTKNENKILSANSTITSAFYDGNRHNFYLDYDFNRLNFYFI